MTQHTTNAYDPATEDAIDRGLDLARDEPWFEDIEEADASSGGEVVHVFLTFIHDGIAGYRIDLATGAVTPIRDTD